MSEVKTRAERIALKVRRKQRLVRVALGEEKADVVLKNADYVNVFSGTVEHGDIAVANGLVVGMADHYDGLMEVDVSGKIVAPGFIDAHIHLESSLVSPTSFARAVLPHGTTTVITSHSLRELEDTCDQLALLHKGGIIFESDIQDLKTSLFKVQVAFNYDYGRELFQNIDMLSFSKKGTVSNFIVRGDRERTIASLRSMNPILLDVLPLSLEEVFIYEMEALGYAFKDILM